MYKPPKLERFQQNVLSKFNVYNSIFLTLPFDEIDNTGSLLPLFSKVCEEGFANKMSPKQIVELFSEKYLGNAPESQLIDMMFRFIQYIERQIVLFDAIEDAAFPIVNNLDGKGSLREVKENAEDNDQREALREFLEYFNVRPVLTAHPTQFYPGSVLGIITDLTEAVRQNDLNQIQQLLSQLGKTPFIKKEKPTPFDEAVSLVWYLENVFYNTAGDMANYIQKNIFMGEALENPVIQLGFWPGGDRDGNPFVTSEITLKVANRLQTSVFKCYYADIRKLRRKLTFAGVDILVASLEEKIYRSAFYSSGQIFITLDELKSALDEIRNIVIASHQSLYLEEIDGFVNRVKLFGFYFASLDIRQNSKIHDSVLTSIAGSDSVLPENYPTLPNIQKMEIISSLDRKVEIDLISDELVKSTFDSILAMKTIQERNGEQGSNRYIISNNESAINVMETYSFFVMSGWKDPKVDIVPLFEVIDDLRNAASIMEELYTNITYAAHLKRRQNKQIVMLGFSDGTKDGGYLMANWSIFKAKEEITAMSDKHGINVIFFDGRGGPPARGGGKTHKFYASLGPSIANREIQITVQGQTISSNFGTPDSCRYNLENLLSAGISNHFNQKNSLSTNERQMIEDLAHVGFKKYTDFKNHPKFIPYLERMSTLKYYSKANIGSRPSKRGQSERLDFSDLRAIPFVASWSHLKQNVPGFFGVGSALKAFEENGKWEQIVAFYESSLFFRTLLENSMMSLAKSFFPLTSYMRDDAEFGAFWQIIFDEYTETKRLLLKIAGHSELMENYPDGKASIATRERIVQPLLVLQQYALFRISELAKDDANAKLISVYEKIVTRSLFGNTNASRNSA